MKLYIKPVMGIVAVFNRLIIVIGLLLVLGACSPEATNPVGKAYHNTTAHFNAYFIAKERIKEIEASIERGNRYNYDEVLDIFPQFDSTMASSMEDQLNDCVEKASISIQRHPNSKWVDDSYVLVGKARLYGMDFPNAVETFKYVNTNGENDNARHEALVSLMRTFIENNEYANAVAVSDYLKKEDLNSKNLKDLHLTRAYLFQKVDDYDNMVQNLSRAAPLLEGNREQAKIFYIMGQVYQELGFDAEAYNYYKLCLRNNPEYELSFFAKLNMAQVTQLSNISDLKKARKYFKKLIKDPKNLEFRDKIYYELANFELKQSNLNEAIDNYNKSLRASSGNQRQMGYSYWKLGLIYYDSLKNYELAKAYYDSTVSAMPKTEDIYEEIAERQRILADFVTQLTIIHDQDSLLDLAQMDSSALVRYLDTYIAAQMIEEEQERKKQKREEARASRSTVFETDRREISTDLSGSTWYFYNTATIGQGRTEFRRIWGDRQLEDNWRRSNKGQIAEEALVAAENPAPSDPLANEPADNDAEARRDALWATVPRSADRQAEALGQIEEAYYKLGGIYDFDLDEKDNAISTFETMLDRFPQTEYRAEVLYQLYLLLKELGESRFQEYGDALVREFPETIYAKLVQNPNYREESQATAEKLKKIYATAYKLYEHQHYDSAKAILQDAYRQYPDNDFSDNIKLLEILVIGATDDVYKYQYELDNFITTYSESEMLPYAETLAKASRDYQINRYNSSRAKFIKYFDQVHKFVLVYQTSNRDASAQLPGMIQKFTKVTFPDKKYLTGNLILDANYSMILVTDFQTKAEALTYFNSFNEALDPSTEFLSTEFYNFVITEDNFKILYETRELDTYLDFFEKNYQ